MLLDTLGDVTVSEMEAITQKHLLGNPGGFHVFKYDTLLERFTTIKKPFLDIIDAIHHASMQSLFVMFYHF